jgi:beta-lactamase superfamily II metal-dependent hydrolase
VDISGYSECPLAVISVGKNSYGHPAAETITRLKAKGLDVLRTDQSGDIEVTSDGTGWSVNTSGTPVGAKSSNQPKAK